MPFVTDTFTGTTGTALQSHTGETGATWSLMTGNGYGGGMALDGANGVYCSSASGIVEYSASGTAATADYEVSVDFVCKTDVQLAGLLFRYDTSAKTGYQLQHRQFYGFRLMSVNSGSETLISNIGNELSAAQTSTMRVTCIGTTITIYQDGVQIYQVVDSSYSGLHVGFSGGAAVTTTTGIHFDNLSAAASMTVATPTASSVTQTTLTVTTAGAQDGTGTVNYQFQRAPDSSGSPGTFANIGSNSTALFINDTGRTQNTTYWYRVIATDGASHTATSGNLSVTMLSSSAPGQVTGLTVSPLTATSIQLNWSVPSGTPTSYNIYRSTTSGTETLLTTSVTNSYLNTGLSSGQIYYYKIGAVNANGEGTLSAEGSATPGVPGVPTGLVCTAYQDYGVFVTWDRVGSGETGFVLQRKTGAGAYATLVTLGAGNNCFNDMSGFPATTYTYKIKATYGVSSETSFSSEVPVTTVASLATASTFTGLSVAVTDAWTLTISWTDPNSAGRDMIMERSIDGLNYQCNFVDAVPVNGANSYADTPLSPSTLYYYRLRCVTYGGTHSAWATTSGTTSARPAGVPTEQQTVSHVVNSSTSTTVSWIDNNAGAVTWKIETATIDTFGAPSWSQIATQAGPASAGATVNYALTTTAEQGLFLRVRPSNGSGNGGYSVPIEIRSASGGALTSTYNVGPGKTYATINALDWTQLGPGAIVNIYPNRDGGNNIVPYYQKFLISFRGTAAAHITIQGVPDPTTGALPIFDGTNATTGSQFAPYYQPLEDGGLCTYARRPSQQRGWCPGYVDLKYLKIQNAFSGSFTRADGTAGTYASPYALYVTMQEHCTVSYCQLYNNGGAIFAAGGRSGSAPDAQQPCKYLTVANNEFQGNGIVGGFLNHTSYIEGINTVYEFNRYGITRTGAAGGALKDRGSGTIIRWNRFEGGTRLIDCVEPQNYHFTTLTLPEIHTVAIYGNEFFNRAATGSITGIHWAGDQGVVQTYRKGIAQVFNNSFINKADQTEMFFFNLVQATSNNDTDSTTPQNSCVDFRNNVVLATPTTGGAAYTELDLLSPNGCGYFGKNWISTGYQSGRTGYTFTGVAAGTSQITNNGSTNDPGYVSNTTPDFLLKITSELIDASTSLNSIQAAYAFGYELQPPSTAVTHAIQGSEWDIGAHEYGGVPAGPTTPATGYTVTHDSVLTSGVASTIRVDTTPANTIFNGSTVITVTGTGSGGASSPAPQVTPANGTLTATVQFTATGTGSISFHPTNTGGLTNPGDFSVTVSLPQTTTYTVSEPSNPTGGGVNVASGTWSVAITASTTVTSTIVTPASNKAGSFTPSTVTLNGDNASSSFTFTPTIAGDHTVSFTNDGGLTDPSSVFYAAVTGAGGGGSVVNPINGLFVA